MIEEIWEGKLGPQNCFVIYILHYFFYHPTPIKSQAETKNAYADSSF